MPGGERLESVVELGHLHIDRLGTVWPVSSPGPSPGGGFQEFTNLLEIGGNGQVGLAKIVERVVGQVAKRECGEFGRLVVDRFQFQDVFEIEAIGALEVIAEGGDSDPG